MVRVFAAGDFHGDKTIAKKLAQQAIDEKADIILLNGDIVEEHDTDGIIYHFVNTKKPVFLIPGNHDWFATEFLAARYGAENLHAKSTTYAGIGLIGCGGANIGTNMLTEKEIYDLVKKTDSQLKTKKKILVTHVHPAQTKMEHFSDFVKGSIGLRKAIEKTKPDFVICGHVHEAEGIEEKIGDTRVINVGKKGKLIEL